MPTTPGGRWSPNDGDDWDLTTDLATMQVSNESATAAAIAAIPPSPQNYRTGTNAQRLALSGANLFEGLKFWTTDTDREWIYSGTAWLSNDGGSYLIRPTTVTGGTIGADGVTTFAGVSAVSLNGVFTTRFREFEVQWTITSRSVTGGTGVESIRLRAAGTDSIVNQYAWRRFVSSGTTISPAVNASDASFSSMASSGYTYSTKAIHLIGPALTAQTRIYGGKGMETDSAGNFEQVIDYAGEHKVASAFDGITLYVGAGTINGSIRVIGYP